MILTYRNIRNTLPLRLLAPLLRKWKLSISKHITHSRFDKAAKFMWKEDAQMSNCKLQSDCSGQSEKRVGKMTTKVNLDVCMVQLWKKVLLIDVAAQANLTMVLGYNRYDYIPITLSTAMQNIIDEKSFDVSLGIIHNGGTGKIWSD